MEAVWAREREALQAQTPGAKGGRAAKPPGAHQERMYKEMVELQKQNEALTAQVKILQGMLQSGITSADSLEASKGVGPRLSPRQQHLMSLGLGRGGEARQQDADGLDSRRVSWQQANPAASAYPS
jgi:hypothetical protein